MKKKKIMPLELIQEIFPNLEELIEIHSKYNLLEKFAVKFWLMASLVWFGRYVAFH